MTNEEPTTQPRQVRVATGIWTAYDAVCKRLGRTRAEDLNAHMRRMIKRHGTPEEIELLNAAEAELEERRTRKYSGLRSGKGKTTK